MDNNKNTGSFNSGYRIIFEEITFIDEELFAKLKRRGLVESKEVLK